MPNDGSKYLNMMMEREEGQVDVNGKKGKAFEYPEHVVKAFTNCKTKLRHCVSKVVVEGNSNDIIAKEVLDWLKDVKPIVVQK